MNNALITIVSLSVSGSILALILFAGKPLLKNRVSKAFSYYIWLFVLLRLVMPIAAPVNVMGSLFGIEQPSMHNIAAEQTNIPSGNGTVQTGKQAAVSSNTQAVSQEPQNDNAGNTQAPADTQRSFTTWDFIKNNLLWIWLAGSIISLVWFITAYACFSRRIRRSCLVPHSDDLAVFEQMRENKRVRIACSSYVATPMFVGVLRPIIVLPQLAYVKNGMNKELLNILRHELTHYRRKDVLYKWLVVAVTSLHWFNPLMILIRKEISRACELSCDEVVISGMSADEKQSYGNTLLALSANRKLSAGIFATTLCEDKKELKERLVSIMKYRKKSTWAVAMTLVLMLLLAGCAATLGVANTMAPSDSAATGSYSKIDSTNSLQQNEKPSLADSTKNSTTTATTTGNAIDYNQYLKRTWIRNTDTNFPDGGGLSILISKIGDGKIQGKLSAVGKGPAYNMDSAEFEGTVNNGTAECQLVNDSRGNKGTIKILFKPDSTLDTTIIITEKSEDTIMRLSEGTFEFTPYNLKNIKGFALIENQTFMVDLNSWGNVKFVSGKLTAGNHIPVVFYLTNKDGDILYNFNATLPYSVDVKAVSFEDVNKDGLKDIIIIVADNYDGSSGEPIATVYLQKDDGSFTNDYKLDQEINDSGNNKDIGTVTNYLSSKF